MKLELEPEANLTITVKDVDGNVIREEKTHNLVVTSGRNLIRDHLWGGSPNPLTHFALGNGSAVVLISDVQLQYEQFRAAFTSLSKTDAKLTMTYFLTTAQANGITLTEAGVFNADFQGAMYARALFSAISKTASMSVTFTWELSWS